ncbi:alkylation response protein AidB-like acyl-CoA dehydrogenase [Herbihabitans rhizosphaerae]|uniref:Alkylation response protein AidB-like acyl-CoA dehydrogenase n=1 Tax=Herbihabitans rhizosphaerae TaxID=1872711 RepID=A0A4Q7L1Q4_9PSEU|nr:acyl-CoA dehydrogenase family protein [Herbihabitans rhizosphaerae]RZS43117.1 alkylation response protein AidB-like acyl-CoA dehydrogenase [Herbihabitans rhizosphaerae]
MDLTLTEDQQLVQSTAREFLAGRAGADGSELWKEIVDLGWTGLALPEDSGGVGSDFLDVCLLAEELGRAGVATPFTPTVAAALAIAEFGTPQQKQDVLPAIVEGRTIALARGHWGAEGSDLTATPAGDGYTVDGRALFVPFAGEAAELLVIAGTVVALVDVSTPGITRERLDVVGNEPMYSVTFDGVSVAAQRVLADGVDAVTAYATVLTCAEMVGGAQAVLDMTVDYATQRRQFDKPIGTFQAVQHHCANMAIDVLGSRFATYEAAWKLDTGQDAGTEINTAKAFVSDAYERVCALGHQVHGAIGFTAEHELHRYLRHATAAALNHGDADFHLDQLATRLGL